MMEVKKCITSGLNLNGTDSSGLTALMVAAIVGEVKIISLLLDSGAIKGNMVDLMQMDAISYAILCGNSKVLEHLLTVATISTSSPVFRFVTNSPFHVDLWLQLVKSGTPRTILNDKFENALTAAVKADNVDAARAAISLGMRPTNSNALKDLLCYAHPTNLAMKALLSPSNENIEAQRQKSLAALISAVVSRSSLVLEELLKSPQTDRRAKDAHGWTAVHHAVHSGDGLLPLSLEILEILLRDGFPVTETTNNGDTPLHVLAESDWPEEMQQEARSILRMLVGYNGSLNSTNNDSRTPRMVAAMSGRPRAVEIFLEPFDADYIASDKYGQTALHLGASTGSVEVVRRLLDCGFSKKLNKPALGNFNATPLMLAAAEGHAGVVGVLLDMDGIDLNVVDKFGFSAAHLAVEKNHTAVLKRLMGKGVDLNSHNHLGHTPLLLAVDTQNMDAVELLLGDRSVNLASVDNQGRSALHLAVLRGNTAFVQRLLALGVSPNLRDTRGRSPLFVAVDKGYIPICKLLLATPLVNVEMKDNEGSSALLLALEREPALLELLLAAKADVNTAGPKGSPLLVAISTGKAAAIDRLLRVPNIDMHSTDPERLTALHLAAARNDSSLLKRLLQLGASVNASTPFGVTPLMLAAQLHCKDVVKTLLAVPGIDVTKHDKQGRTALHYAVGIPLSPNDGMVSLHSREKESASSSSPEVVKMLLAANSSTDAAVPDGPTVLEYLIEYGTGPLEEIAEILILAGANPQGFTSSRRTLLCHAVRRGHLSLARLFMNKGVDLNYILKHDLAFFTDDTGARATSVLRMFFENGTRATGALLLRAVREKMSSSCVKEILLAGANVNFRGPDDITPLLLAAKLDNIPVLDVLLADKAVDLRATDARGRGALQLALLEKSTPPFPTVTSLVHKGFSTNQPDKNRFVPLNYVFKRGEHDHMWRKLHMFMCNYKTPKELMDKMPNDANYRFERKKPQGKKIPQ